MSEKMTDDKWKDVTSLSRGEKRVPGSGVFERKVGRFRMCILNTHRWYPGEWRVSIYPGPLADNEALAATDLEAAKLEANRILSDMLIDAMDVLHGRKS